MQSAVGQTLDNKYKIESQLGKGGMGTVYLATHLGTERPVAVKIIASEFMKRAEFVERFRREARAAGRLRHPNVVDVTDFGFSKTANGDVAYLVMEYLDGCTLGEILKEEKNLPVSWTVDILEQVCSAVHEAHRQGIIHRDLKPDNIWLEPNQRGGYTVKVLDFGIAKLEESQLTIPERAGVAAAVGSETQLIDGNQTLADASQVITIIDGKNSTVVGDSATMAILNNSANLKSEAGTLIQSDEIEEKASDNYTKLISADEEATKLISGTEATEKSKIQSTSNNRFDPPSTAELTRVGAVLGTPLYMSPEQCRGEKLTPHSDIYSLGVIAYQMLSGKTPFEGDYSAVMEAHKEFEPPALEAKKVPKKVKQVISASLSKCIEDRPHTAEGFGSELRASSEGIGSLLRRAFVIYGEHIAKFLAIAFLLAIPSIVLMAMNVVFRFIVAIEILSDSVGSTIFSGGLSFLQFFAQIFAAALLVGMSTWIVAQVLAAPLRPISVRATFHQVYKRWKPLIGTVTFSTLIAMVGLAFCLLPGVWLSARFMLIAPSIVMEGVSGRNALRRSTELVKRSFRTVLATSVLVYIIPFVVAVVIAITLNGMMNTFDPPKQAVEPIVGENTEVSQAEPPDLNFKLDGEGVRIESGQPKIVDAEKTMAKRLRGSIQQGLYELLLAPISILFMSFTSVITALLYFKTRQAGGESMQELLQQFEDDECEISNWKKRVRERLLQSGRTTTGKKFING